MNGPTKFGILGPIVVRTAGGSFEHPTGREARVLAGLLISHNETIRLSDLVKLVWGAEQPASPETALHNVVYRLRKLLEQGGVAECIDKEADGYVIRCDPWMIDSVRFECMIGDAEREEPAKARTTLTEAIDLWRGEPFGSNNNVSPHFRAEAERLSALHWIAIEDRISCELRIGNSRELVPELIGLTTREPIRETLWAYLMAALYQSGQRGRAYQAFKQAEEYLARELGIPPSRTLQTLATAIVDQDDDLVDSVAERSRTG